MRYCLLLAAALLLAACSRPSAPAADDAFDASAAIAYCHRQVLRSLAQMTAADGTVDFTVMPRCVAAGDTAWTLRPVCAEEWCSGFYPGILWLDYSLTPDPAVRRAAMAATDAMQVIVEKPVFDHDLGFLVFCSAGTALRVLTRELADGGLPDSLRRADEAALARYRRLCERAADSLATLFRPAVGTILSWPRATAKYGGHNTIMDNMLNLELLCWAADEGSSALAHRDSLRAMAVSHARTTMRHHFRADGSTYHVAVYDSVDGRFIRGVTHQGLSDSSTWARGQAWAVYGFTMMARATGSKAFLRQACTAADVFLSRLPADGVPFWDFSDPRIATSPEGPAPATVTSAPRDASAAAVVASALVELASLTGDAADAACYMAAARCLLSALSSADYQSRGANSAFLLHSTGNLPRGSEVDVPIVYADYYYLEALSRLAER